MSGFNPVLSDICLLTKGHLMTEDLLIAEI